MNSIIIFDTTLRDGEQSPGATMDLNKKLIFAKQLEKVGVDVIEAGYPFASEGDFEAVKRIAKEVRGPSICGLARTNKADILKCYEAVKYARSPRIHTFIATSNIHMDKKLKMSKEEVLDSIKEHVTYARSLCEDVEFSLEDSTRTDYDFMIEATKIAVESGARTINLPDTVGYSQPEEYGERIEYVFEKLGDLIYKNNVVVSVHCHNDLGNAVANSLMAIRKGARQVECTINGIGERAGNASLEEIAMNILTRQNYFGVGLNLNPREFGNSSRLLSELTGLYVSRNKPIVGVNAFSHEAGIHQDGILKDKSTYEIMKPEDVGWIGENLVIGKHSGKAAVEEILKKEGYEFTTEKIKEITREIKDYADSNKNIRHLDVLNIARNYQRNQE